MVHSGFSRISSQASRNRFSVKYSPKLLNFSWFLNNCPSRFCVSPKAFAISFSESVGVV